MLSTIDNFDDDVNNVSSIPILPELFKTAQLFEEINLAIEHTGHPARFLRVRMFEKRARFDLIDDVKSKKDIIGIILFAPHICQFQSAVILRIWMRVKNFFPDIIVFHPISTE